MNAERHDLVPADFLQWASARDSRGKRVCPRGLEVRRKAEAAMYRGE